VILEKAVDRKIDRPTREEIGWKSIPPPQKKEGEGISSLAFHDPQITKKWCSKEDSNLHRFPY
jgi:hypothetical protein